MAQFSEATQGQCLSEINDVRLVDYLISLRFYFP
jgi:hypothetical protein